jgi:AcrR family transcriptional regulator
MQKGHNLAVKLDKKQKNRRHQILEAAIKLFTELGFHETKLDEVAQMAGVAKGTLYLYFKSKDDLFVHCLLDGSEKYLVRSQKIIAGNEDFKDRLLKLVELQSEAFAHNGPLIQQFIQSGRFFSGNSDTSQIFFEHIKKKVMVMADFFQAAKDAGILTQRLSSKQMALIFNQIFDLNIKFKLFDEPMLPAKDCCETLYSLFKNENTHE